MELRAVVRLRLLVGGPGTWVKNCSLCILSDPELSVLKKGLNFAVTPKRLPVVDLVTVTALAFRQLGGGDANELRSKVVNIVGRGEKFLEKDHNITKEEKEALDGLSKDDTIMVLPADKGRVIVVIDKQSYLDKCQELLKYEKTYKKF